LSNWSHSHLHIWRERRIVIALSVLKSSQYEFSSSRTGSPAVLTLW
jgi:hypothetical protein